MPESTAFTGDVEAELRRYFAATTSTALPGGVMRISARSLGRPRAPWTGWLAGGLGALATAALVAVVATHAGSQGSTASKALSAGGAAPQQSAVPNGSSTVIAYPGVDMTRLAASGVVLLDPAGHGSPSVTAVQAQAIAVSAIGSQAGTPGPALLAFVEAMPPAVAPTTCLCWVVDIRVGGNVAQGPPVARFELVLIDAMTRRVVAVLSANGTP
jgi:hypothetical protein